MDKLSGNVLSICATSDIVKGDQFSPLMKPLRHIVAGLSNSGSLLHQGQACHSSPLRYVGLYL
jgi:hypothetical protein